MYGFLIEYEILFNDKFFELSLGHMVYIIFVTPVSNITPRLEVFKNDGLCRFAQSHNEPYQ